MYLKPPEIVILDELINTPWNNIYSCRDDVLNRFNVILFMLKIPSYDCIAYTYGWAKRVIETLVKDRSTKLYKYITT